MSEQIEFKIGDMVKLQSGGPEMTISEMDGGWITCTYWNFTSAEFGKITLHPDTVYKIS